MHQYSTLSHVGRVGVKEKHKAIFSEDMVIATLAYHNIYAKKSTANIIRCFMEDPEMAPHEIARRCDVSSANVYHFIYKYERLGVVKSSKAKDRMYGRVDIDPGNKLGLWD